MSEVHSIETEEPQVVKQVMSVGGYCRALIKKADLENLHLSNEDMAAKVVAKFKEHGVEVKTSAACIAWYKSDMRKKGLLTSKSSGKKVIEIELDDL